MTAPTPPPADPDRACLHEHFDAVVEVTRIADDPAQPPTGYMADVRVVCAQCGEKFRWTGCPAGMSPARPMVSPDETELRAPIRPASADPDFGLALPGFAITRTDPGAAYG